MFIRLIPILSGIVGGYQGYRTDNLNQIEYTNKKDVYAYLGISTSFLSIYVFSFGAGILGSILAASTINGGFYGGGYFVGKIIK